MFLAGLRALIGAAAEEGGVRGCQVGVVLEKDLGFGFRGDDGILRTSHGGGAEGVVLDEDPAAGGGFSIRQTKRW